MLVEPLGHGGHVSPLALPKSELAVGLWRVSVVAHVNGDDGQAGIYQRAIEV